MPHPSTRSGRPPRCGRRAGVLALAIGLALSLAGCGFQLRQPTEIGYSRVALAGFAPRSPMAEALARALPASARVVEAPADAQVVVQALDDRFTRTVAASTAAGQVREFRLRVTLRFRLMRPDGRALSSDTELEQQRDLSYSETSALGKEAEEAAMVREMRADIAQQLVRMVGVVGRPETN